ncbi:PAS domain-containing sensor histidine kinase [Ramlibacter sp. MMS24-I3-19]|uniref:sensor histidine kinase n=1 Tax=Ramlibacter sp. MMS24-I3-19 TaxID=3416606 RepID=UPI003CFF2D0B
MSEVEAQRHDRSVPECAVFLIDDQHRLASWNAGVQHLLGWSETGWIGQPFADLCAQDAHASGLLTAQLGTAAERGTAEGHVVFRRRNGTRVEVALTLAALPPSSAGSQGWVAACWPMPGAAGTSGIRDRAADAVLGVFTDGRGDAALAAAFVSALEAVPDGVYVGTQKGIVYCNRPALDMLGARSVEDLRARIDELGHRFRVRRERGGPPLPPRELPFVRALNGEPAVLETWATRPDGSDVFIRGTAAPIRVDGLVAGAIAINSDITERLLLEEAAKTVRDEAEQANRLKDEFLAVVSHELRAPLSAMLGWATLLQRSERGASPLLQKGLAAIDRNARLQNQLVDDLLDVSRMQAGQLRLEMHPVDLTEVVGTAIDAVHPGASEKGVRIDVDIDAEPTVVLGDATRLQQVVFNLLANAIKFTGEGGSVRVSLEDGGENLRITVSDTGQGIDPAFLPHVFDRFRQEEGATTRRHGGLGLGLSIVRDLVQLHGGHVSADSEGRGEGARFEVVLPRLVADRNPT